MFDYSPPVQLLADKIILVTGAGEGIGRAAALTYAAHGATVILLGRQVDKLEQVYDDIEAAAYPQAAIFPMDLKTAGSNEFQQLAAGIEQEFGRLDGILHNAGILGPLVPLQTYAWESWQEVMQINLNAAFGLTQALLPLLQASEDASVIFTSSGVGRKPRAYWGAYSVSKSAVEALVQVLAQELDETYGIRVNSINPGPCATKMRRQAHPSEDPSTLAKPEELMNVYLYLMGADSKGQTGRQFDAQS